MSDIINTANNAFTYTSSSEDSIYVASTVNNKIAFDTVSAKSYIRNINNTISSTTPTFYNIQSANSVLTANTEVTVAQQRITSCNKLVVSIAVPIQVDDFLKITDSDSITITIKMNNNTLATYSTPFSIQPVTLINKSFVFDSPSGGTLSINVTSTLPATYVMGTNKVDNVGLLPFNANTALCF